MKIPYDGHVRLKRTNTDVIKVLLTGDLCPVAEVEREFMQRSGEEVFGNVLPLLHYKDISITNLELALTAKGKPIDKCGQNIRANPDILLELWPFQARLTTEIL